MREIEFRGKRIDNGEWVVGNYVKDNEATHITIPLKETHYLERVDPATVGEFTGLCDKDGKKIFEHDVVRHGYTCKYSSGATSDFYNNMPISFSNNYGGWIVGEHNILTTKNVEKYSIEVIGNLHDNPELLQEGKDAD